MLCCAFRGQFRVNPVDKLYSSLCLEVHVNLFVSLECLHVLHDELLLYVKIHMLLLLNVIICVQVNIILTEKCLP